MPDPLTLRIVCLSDTHGFGERIKVPDGDVLIHAGDHTLRGTEEEIRAAFQWLESLPHRHKIIIAGNHDFLCDPNAPPGFRSWSLRRTKSREDLLAEFSGLTYLQDSGTCVEGLKFYGSPWSILIGSGNRWAFNYDSVLWYQEQARKTWAQIPDDTDVLITHAPPRGILDGVQGYDEHVSDEELRKRISRLDKLRLHVFGHMHEGYGKTEHENEDGNSLVFVNAAICTMDYDPTNAPIVVTLKVADAEGVVSP